MRPLGRDEASAAVMRMVEKMWKSVMQMIVYLFCNLFKITTLRFILTVNAQALAQVYY